MRMRECFYLYAAVIWSYKMTLKLKGTNTDVKIDIFICVLPRLTLISNIRILTVY